jgi:hypothetical protein
MYLEVERVEEMGWFICSQASLSNCARELGKIYGLVSCFISMMMDRCWFRGQVTKARLPIILTCVVSQWCVEDYMFASHKLLAFGARCSCATSARILNKDMQEVLMKMKRLMCLRESILLY